MSERLHHRRTHLVGVVQALVAGALVAPVEIPAGCGYGVPGQRVQVSGVTVRLRVTYAKFSCMPYSTSLWCNRKRG